MKKFLLILLVLSLSAIFSAISFNYVNAGFDDDNIISKNSPIKILLVPGHDKERYGTEFKNIKEADLNSELAELILDLFKKDPEFDVLVTRSKDEYNKIFADYFSEQRDNIITFKEKAKKNTKKLTQKRHPRKKLSYVNHPVASKEGSIILHGINKWAQENEIDAIAHIHFNDYPRRNISKAGKLSGFTIYYPGEDLVNSKESLELAKSIFNELKKGQKISNHVKEKNGLTKDITLIAVGANNTLSEKNKSILIEYGYIYEKKLHKDETRSAFLKKMAELTYNGIVKYFKKH